MPLPQGLQTCVACIACLLVPAYVAGAITLLVFGANQCPLGTWEQGDKNCPCCRGSERECNKFHQYGDDRGITCTSKSLNLLGIFGVVMLGLPVCSLIGGCLVQAIWGVRACYPTFETETSRRPHPHSTKEVHATSAVGVGVDVIPLPDRTVPTTQKNVAKISSVTLDHDSTAAAAAELAIDNKSPERRYRNSTNQPDELSSAPVDDVVVSSTTVGKQNPQQDGIYPTALACQCDIV